MEGLPLLMKPTDAHPFLLIHMGPNDTAKMSYKEGTSDFEALGRKFMDVRAQIVFLFILPVLRRGI